MKVSWPYLLDLILGDKKNLSFRPKIYPQNLLQISILCIFLVIRDSKKQQRRGWDYSNFKKGEHF